MYFWLSLKITGGEERRLKKRLCSRATKGALLCEDQNPSLLQTASLCLRKAGERGKSKRFPLSIVHCMPNNNIIAIFSGKPRGASVEERVKNLKSQQSKWTH